MGHLYNLRASAGYRAQRVVLTKTRATQAHDWRTQAPAPEGRAGFIRIDSVHQGDQDGTKGLYHINAVDCVTQWRVVATDADDLRGAPAARDRADAFEQFPFAIIGFHADNGSEYVNHAVAACWTKLRIGSSPAAAAAQQRQRPG